MLRMKKKLFLLMPFCALLTTSCIKDEPLNSECDIEVCKVHHEASDTIFYALSDTLQKVSSVDTVINFYTRSRINPQDLSQVRVTFDLTPGATITPANGSVQFVCGERIPEVDIPIVVELLR